MKHLYTPALCCSCSTMTLPQWWVGACTNAEYRRRLLHPTLLVLNHTPPRSWVCILGFRQCRQTDAQKVWNNLFHQQFKPARFSFLKWSARSYFWKKKKNFLRGDNKRSVWWHDTSYCTDNVLMMTWYFILYGQRISYSVRTWESSVIFSFVRTFWWSLWFSSSQPLNLPSEDKKSGWCYYLRFLTLCSAPYKW